MILQADTISGSRAGVSRLQPSQFQRLSDVSPYQRGAKTRACVAISDDRRAGNPALRGAATQDLGP